LGGVALRKHDSRLVGHYHGSTWYAVPGVDRTICLVGIEGQLSWGGCTHAAVLKDRVIYDGWENAQHEVEVAALANDGLTRVTYPGGATGSGTTRSS